MTFRSWHFRRQQIVAGFIVDFYCHKAGMVIEIDGPIHAKREIGDIERTKALTGSADQIASAFSAGLKSPGDTLIKLGSAGDIPYRLGEPLVDPHL
ncbi:MAG: DUF559 domain-containing protein [Anaerolineales bacterium]|nr:DUF559 domain-containing protein [Anaerolineales bacterium]